MFEFGPIANWESNPTELQFARTQPRELPIVRGVCVCSVQTSQANAELQTRQRLLDPDNGELSRNAGKSVGRTFWDFKKKKKRRPGCFPGGGFITPPPPFPRPALILGSRGPRKP